MRHSARHAWLPVCNCLECEEAVTVRSIGIEVKDFCILAPALHLALQGLDGTRPAEWSLEAKLPYCCLVWLIPSPDAALLDLCLRRCAGTCTATL